MRPRVSNLRHRLAAANLHATRFGCGARAVDRLVLFDDNSKVTHLAPPPDYMIVYRVNATCRREGGDEMFAEYDLEPGTNLSDADKEWLCEYMKQFPMITALVVDRSRGSS